MIESNHHEFVIIVGVAVIFVHSYRSSNNGGAWAWAWNELSRMVWIETVLPSNNSKTSRNGIKIWLYWISPPCMRHLHRFRIFRRVVISIYILILWSLLLAIGPSWSGPMACHNNIGLLSNRWKYQHNFLAVKIVSTLCSASSKWMPSFASSLRSHPSRAQKIIPILINDNIHRSHTIPFPTFDVDYWRCTLILAKNDS